MKSLNSLGALFLTVVVAAAAQTGQRKKRPAPEPKAVTELRKNLEDAQNRLAGCEAELEHQKAHYLLLTQIHHPSQTSANRWNDLESQLRFGPDLKRLAIRLVTDPITGADAYRAAASGVIRSQFASECKLDPEANWVLTIGGTNLNASTQAQYVEVELSHPVRIPLATGEIAGKLRLASDAAMFTRFTEGARVHAVEELVARVLAEAIKSRRN